MTAPYMSPPVVASLLGTTPENVIGWIKAGLLPASNIALPGSTRPRWRISPAALDQFLAARAACPPSPTTRRRAKETLPRYV